MPETVSPSPAPIHWRIILMPALFALLGMLIAFVCVVAGQDDRRAREFRQRDYNYYYWLAERDDAILQIARLQQTANPSTTQESELAHLQAELPKLEKLVTQFHAAQTQPIVSYARYGRQFTPWDGYRYEEIVDQGYAFHQPFATTMEKDNPLLDVGGPEKRSKNVVWYPLYPFLASGLTYYFSITSTNALTVVSWSCAFLGAIVTFLFARQYFFNRMTALHLPESQTIAPYDLAALWTVALLFFGPCSVFLYANFTESLFVLLLASFLYCMQARWWWRAALVAAFASASRSQGVLFGPILALVYLFRGDGPPLKRLGVAFAMGVISGMGLLCYMLFLRGQYDDPLAFMHAQKYWNVGLSLDRILFALNPANAETHILGFLFYKGEIDWPRLWEALCLLWPAALLLILGWRYLTPDLLIVAWILWGLPYVSNSMAGNPPFDSQWMSMGRFMAVVIPIYLILGAVFTRHIRFAIFMLIPWSAAFAIFAYKYGDGQWVG